MMSPEEVLMTSLHPTLQAVNNYATGQTDFAKMQYLNQLKRNQELQDAATRRSQELQDFSTRAKEARELFAIHTSAQSKLNKEQAKYAEDRADKRYAEARKEAEETAKRQADRLTLEQKQMAIRNLQVEHAKNGFSFPEKGDMTDEQYLVKLSGNMAEKSEAKKAKDEAKDAENAAQVAGSFDDRNKRIAQHARSTVEGQITPEFVDQAFLKRALQLRVGVDADGNFGDPDRAKKLQDDYLRSKGNTTILGLTPAQAGQMKEQIRKELVNKLTIELLRTELYTDQIKNNSAQAAMILRQTPGASELYIKKYSSEIPDELKVGDAPPPPPPPGSGAGATAPTHSFNDIIAARIGMGDQTPTAPTAMPQATFLLPTPDAAAAKISPMISAGNPGNNTVTVPPEVSPLALRRNPMGKIVATGNGPIPAEAMPSWGGFMRGVKGAAGWGWDFFKDVMDANSRTAALEASRPQPETPATMPSAFAPFGPTFYFNQQ